MPMLKAPRYWLAQTVAVLLMFLLWAILARYAYTSQIAHHLPPNLGSALALATMLWMYVVMLAPFLVLSRPSQRRLAIAQALARLTAVVVGLVLLQLGTNWSLLDLRLPPVLPGLLAAAGIAVLCFLLSDLIRWRYDNLLANENPTPA